MNFEEYVNSNGMMDRNRFERLMNLSLTKEQHNKFLNIMTNRCGLGIPSKADVEVFGRIFIINPEKTIGWTIDEFHNLYSCVNKLLGGNP